MTQTFAFTLSESAKNHYLKLLQKHPSGIGIRFFTKRAGCSGLMYQSEVIESASENDLEVFNRDGLRVFIAKVSMPYLKGIQVDLISQGFGQSQIVYQNPNEIARCGCGESFKVKGDDDAL